MKIALIGYGKMGKAIEAIALEKGHTIGLKINSGNVASLTAQNLQECDVAIEFTSPQHAVRNIFTCIDAGVPVVSGTTGWLDRWEKVKTHCLEKRGGLLYASNFSIGVNIFFELNKKLVSLMSFHPQYDVSVEEIHHTAKKDAPSGTAITIAEQIIRSHPGKQKWANAESGQVGDLLITSKRIDPAPGTHHVRYHSAIDDIEIIHTAHNRQGFAAGALLAAEYLYGKKGIYTMNDVLNIQ
jgi:4-hydroxy-tetrahydrodipicolinate reductase